MKQEKQQDGEAAQVVSDAGDTQDDGLETPYLQEVKDLMRLFAISDKNVSLYPIQGKVVKESIANFHGAAVDLLETLGELRLQVFQTSFQYEEEDVYVEEQKSKSISFRLQKDGVRELIFLPDITLEELIGFLVCLKEARKADEDEDDFSTLFWEKDCANIQVVLADDLSFTDDLPEVPEGQRISSSQIAGRLKIPAEERERLQEVLESRKADDDGDSTFELSAEELQEILAMVNEETDYLPLFDFVDILLELMVRNPDAEAFAQSVHMIRTIIAAVIEDQDWKQAAFLLSKFSGEAHPGLTDAHRRQIKKMVASFNDKQTLHLLKTFLKDNDKLSRDHAVFSFMKSFPREAAESFCQFLSFPNHVRGVSDVLIHIGTHSTEAFVKELGNPDPLVVRAMIPILLGTDKKEPLKKVARALKHPDKSVRLLAAKTMIEAGDRDLGPLLVPLLDESDIQLLYLALQFFSKVPFPEGYERLFELVNSGRFHDLDPKRQRLAYVALLRSSLQKGTDHICKKVLRRRLFQTTKTRQKVNAALNALPASHLQLSEETLQRYAQKKGPFSPTAERALKELRVARQKAAHDTLQRSKEVTEV